MRVYIITEKPQYNAILPSILIISFFLFLIFSTFYAQKYLSKLAVRLCMWKPSYIKPDSDSEEESNHFRIILLDYKH